MPNDQGVTAPVTFRPATLTDYNRAVTALQDREAQRWATQATAAAQDRQQATVRDANDALAYALSSAGGRCEEAHQ